MEVVQQIEFILNHLYRKCELTSEIGALAQLARAPALQAGGQGFESLTLHKVSSSWRRATNKMEEGG